MVAHYAKRNSPSITLKKSTFGARQGLQLRLKHFSPFKSLCKRYIFSSILCFGVVFNLAWLPVAQAATNCADVEIPQEECAALVALYNSTDGVNWDDSPDNGWNITNTPCSWTGITCRGGHVTEIYRFEKRLNGPIPNELGKLSHLTWLNLSRNRWYDSQQSQYVGGLTGAIPKELGNLSPLTELYLWSNQLSGTIPTELGNLSRLTMIELDDNQLSGPIPKELGNLSQLKKLSFSNNQLSDSIPSELGNLSQLTVLGLSSNQLSGSIPSELGNLNQLEWLNLYQNQLSGPIPNELGNLNQLTMLSFYSNKLSGIIPIELGNLSQLTALHLGDNQLSGPIPSELGNLRLLTELDLDHNQLSGQIPSELANLNQLTVLDLDHNQLNGPIPNELGNLGELTRLFLSNNQLNGLIPSELGNLSQLTWLNLYNNQLSGAIPIELGHLSYLTKLSLSSNQLSGSIPNELGNLSQLTELYLNNNQLSGLIPNELGNLSQLMWLNLYHNELSGSIPTELGKLSQLTWLDLGGNELSGPIPTELGQLNQLTRLDLGDNQLSGSIPTELGNLNLLESLRLNSNQLIGDIPLSLTRLSRLCEEDRAGCYFDGLDLGNNQLTTSDVETLNFLNIKDPNWAEIQKLANIDVSPNVLDFGTVMVGTSPFYEQTLTVKNTGNANLKFETIALAGVNTSDFSLYDKCSSQEFLQPNEECQLSAQFIPLSLGEKQATVKIVSNAFTKNVLLTGTVEQAAKNMKNLVPIIPTCPSTGIIQWMCRNHGQVIRDATLEPRANLAGGKLAGTINNQGIISQVTIQPNAVITGGKFTGFIVNEGKLVDFDFVGGSITGGTLAGKIINRSKVGGFFKDVDLAANSRLIGGILKGEIKGDCEAPALLEYLTIRANSYVECVILGEGVILGKKVTLVDVFPILSQVEIINAQGEKINTLFAGGISINGGPFLPRSTLKTSDIVDIRGYIVVDPEPVKQLSEVLVYASYKLLASPESEPPIELMLDTDDKVLRWDGDLANLVPFNRVEVPVPMLEVPVYRGLLEAATLNISLGYRLPDGTVVQSTKTIDARITD
jgi:Leucine-rich repeat (LRR) protein